MYFDQDKYKVEKILKVLFFKNFITKSDYSFITISHVLEQTEYRQFNPKPSSSSVDLQLTKTRM